MIIDAKLAEMLDRSAVAASKKFGWSLEDEEKSPPVRGSPVQERPAIKRAQQLTLAFKD